MAHDNNRETKRKESWIHGQWYGSDVSDCITSTIKQTSTNRNS